MKKFLLFLLMATVLTATTAHSQNAFVYSVTGKSTAGVTKTTLTNIDTAIYSFNVETTSQSVRATVTKSSGNNSKVKVVLQGSYGTKGDGNWDPIDSLVCTNQPLNRKVFNLHTTPGNLIYDSYRFLASADTAGTGTQVSVLSTYQLRTRN